MDEDHAAGCGRHPLLAVTKRSGRIAELVHESPPRGIDQQIQNFGAIDARSEMSSEGVIRNGSAALQTRWRCGFLIGSFCEKWASCFGGHSICEPTPILKELRPL